MIRRWVRRGTTTTAAARYRCPWRWTAGAGGAAGTPARTAAYCRRRRRRRGAGSASTCRSPRWIIHRRIDRPLRGGVCCPCKGCSMGLGGPLGVALLQFLPGVLVALWPIRPRCNSSQVSATCLWCALRRAYIPRS